MIQSVMAKYFMSRLIYFYDHKSDNNAEVEITSHVTLMSVISGVFYARLLHCSSFYIHRLAILTYLLLP